MTISQDELQTIGRLLEANPDPNEATVRAAAQDYLLRGLDDLTRKFQGEIASMRQYQARALEWDARRYWVFLAPLDKNAKPEVVYEDSEVVTVRDPQRQPVRVRRRDLIAFAKAHKLDANELERVGNGEIPEHRGWYRQPGMGGDMLLGKDWVAPVQQDEPTPKNKRAVRRAFQWAAPVVDWTPDK